MQANSSEIHAGQMEGKASCRLALGPKRPSEELRKRHEEQKEKNKYIYIYVRIYTCLNLQTHGSMKRSNYVTC